MIDTHVRGPRRLLPACAALTLALGLLAGGRTAYAAGPARIGLGSAATFAVLAGAPSVTNSGSTIIDGDLGISPAAAVAGFPPGTLNGTIHAADAIALQAQVDLGAAYDDAAGRRPALIVAGGALGGMTLAAGVYTAGGSALDLTGTLILDGQGDPNAVWIFQATSSLATAASSSVTFVNGAQACNVFWQVGGSATLGADSSFAGNVMALSSITMHSRVVLSGRALARDGGVTLMNDSISYPACFVPEPTALPIAAAPIAAAPIAAAPIAALPIAALPIAALPIAAPPILVAVALGPGPTAATTLALADPSGAPADLAPGPTSLILLGVVFGLGGAGLFLGRRWLGVDRTR